MVMEKWAFLILLIKIKIDLKYFGKKSDYIRKEAI